MAMLQMTRIRQSFKADMLKDIEAALRDELDRSALGIDRGKRIAIAVGSRGIANIACIVKQIVSWVAQQGGEPFIVPAMGSHGQATAEGQQRVLEGYGLTEAYIDAPIRSSMKVIELPRGDLDVPVFMDELTSQADGTIVVNRVKPHTSFHGRYESGLMKMIAIGLGKHAQAAAIHSLGVPGLRDLMPKVARQIIAHGNILMGVGIVENAYHEMLKIRVLPVRDIEAEEPQLLELARANMPKLPMDTLDLLIVDEMGKDISGLGMDPNVIGRLKIRGESEPASPNIKVIVVRDLSSGAHGNVIGMGLADIATRRLYEKIDFKAVYENVLTSTFLERGKVPIIAETDRQAIEFAFQALGSIDPANARIARIKNTLRLDMLLVSQAVLREIEDRAEIEVLGPVAEPFDGQGQMCELE